MSFIKKKTIKWDTKLLKGLMEVSNTCEEALKKNIMMLALIVEFNNEPRKNKTGSN